jgi:4-hydroxythreonine-4-phosphate dehydrogenase
MTSDKKIRVGISIGDLNGIGSEIILKSFEDQRMYELCTPVVFGSFKLMNFFKKHFSSKVNLFEYKSVNNISTNKMNVVNVWRDHVNIEFGKEDPLIGKYAIKSLKAAVAALKNREIDVLVTAPINKFNSQAEDFSFPGHTDYLAQELEGDSLMFMVSDKLKVGLLTDHVPVKEVPQHITKELILSKIEIITNSLKQDFRVSRPKIAVLSINPHAGDQGVIGKEDDEVLKPVLEELRSDNQLVYGPYAADSFFGNKTYKGFDAIIAAYHDQGLIPFKTITFGEGVNFTAGLSRVRTSPDHGTAFEIAGKGVADEGSFKKAIFMSISIFRNRSEYLHYSKKPLKTSKE